MESFKDALLWSIEYGIVLKMGRKKNTVIDGPSEAAARKAHPISKGPETPTNIWPPVVLQLDETKKDTPRSVKGGKQKPFSDIENVEILEKYHDGVTELKEGKKWNQNSTKGRFNLIYASKFTNGLLDSGRPFSLKNFEAAVIRLKRKYSDIKERENKSGSGTRSRAQTSDDFMAIADSIWLKDPAVVVHKRYIASASGGMETSDDETQVY
jgi:hypothetical protein